MTDIRIRAVFSLIIFFFIIISARLFYWQILSSDFLGGMAEKQRSTYSTIPAVRGRIFDVNGSPLVINKTAYGISLEPKKINEKDKLISILSKELNIPSSSISGVLEDDSLLWIPFAHKVEESISERIKSSKLGGVYFNEEQKRYYPEGSMSAHLLGFVGKNAKGEDQGYFGIEGFYNEQLRGRDGKLKEEQDALGNPILSGNRSDIPSENGRDMVLYLDKAIQYVAEDKLKEGIEKYNAKGGTVTIIDPFSGGIMAMASYPSYDPGDFGEYPSVYYKNPVASSFYEPGSTFKVLVIAAALTDGKAKPDSKYNEDGPVKIGGFEINTWNRKYHGEITLAQVLQYSSNVGMVAIGRELGKEAFIRYLDDFGLGNLTGVDLEEESYPELRPKNRWYEIDYATASFGQGVAVTPLQMISAVSAIANGGELMEPHVVKTIRLNSRKNIEIGPKVKKRIFSKNTTEIVKEMMVEAVDQGETKFLKPPGFRIAGKTGTAQIPIAGHYDPNKTIASFVGFAPVINPKFVMLVTITEPTSSIWGSETAAPVFFNIAKELFLYFKISSSD